jgi:hypothetical protein
MRWESVARASWPLVVFDEKFLWSSLVSAAIGRSVVRQPRCLGQTGRRHDRRSPLWLTARFAIAPVTALVVLLLFLVPQTIAAAPAKEVRRVLVFNDLGSISSPGFAAIDQAIFAGLEKSPYQIEFYNENLEITLFSDPDSQRGFKEWYVQKYRDRKPDVIIAVGQGSLKFMAGSHETAFPGYRCAVSQRPRRGGKIKASTAKSEVRLLDDERRSQPRCFCSQFGRCGYVLKHSAVSELLKAVRSSSG